MLANVINSFHRWKLHLEDQPFTKHVTLALGTNMIIALIGFLTGLISARLLGPEGRGELAAIQLWGTLLGSLAMFGMDDALVFFSSRNPNQSGAYLLTAYSIVVPGGIILFFIGWFSIPHLLNNQSPLIIFAAQSFLLMIVFNAVIGLPHQVLRALGYWKSWNFLRILPGIGWFIALLWLMYSNIHDPIIFSRYYLVVYFFLILPFLIVCFKKIHPPFLVKLDYVSPMLRYGIPAVLTVLPRTLNLRLDQLIMVGFLNAEALGYYVVAVAWSGASTPIFSAVGPVLFPYLSSIEKADDKLRFLKNKSFLTGFGIFSITIVQLLVTPWLVPALFGQNFSPAIPTALVLVVASGINGINLIMEDSIRGMGYPRKILIAEVISLIITIILLFILLPLWGIIGAAVGSLVAYIVCALLLYLFLVRTK